MQQPLLHSLLKNNITQKCDVAFIGITNCSTFNERKWLLMNDSSASYKVDKLNNQEFKSYHLILLSVTIWSAYATAFKPISANINPFN